MSGFLTESKTRVGFEIEPKNNNFKIGGFAGKKQSQLETYDRLNAFTNKTLAENPHLEFAVDDVKIEGNNILCQAEFKVNPMVLNDVNDLERLRENLSKEIKELYKMVLCNKRFRKKDEIDKYMSNECKKPGREAEIKQCKWQLNDDYFSLCKIGLEHIEGAVFTIPQVIPQHATISVPICKFLKLPKADQELLLGFSADNLEKFVEEYLDKMLKIAVLNAAGEPVFNTGAGNRNRMTPNIKTGLDKIACVANQECYDRIKLKLTEMLPNGIIIQIGNSTKKFGKDEIDALKLIRDRDYIFPEMSIESDSVSLTSEEKVKPLFIDKTAEDIRVLVEYRNTGNGFLHALQAHNEYEFGQFKKLFTKMDSVKEHNRYFSEFFGKEKK